MFSGVGGYSFTSLCETQALFRASLVTAVSKTNDTGTLAAIAAGANPNILVDRVADDYREALSESLKQLLHPDHAKNLSGPPQTTALELFYQRHTPFPPYSDRPLPATDSDAEVVCAFVQHGVQVDRRDLSSQTALYHQSRFVFNAKAINSLLNARANVNAADSVGNTPIIGADEGVTRVLIWA